MVIRDLDAAGCWFVLCVSYPTAAMAKRAWERAERKLNLSEGDRGIGVYRLGPNPGGGVESGAAGSNSVACVTLDEPTARKAERLLADGTPWEPQDAFADALIYRRAQVVGAHAGKSGRISIRRPEGRGATLDASGELHEREPGRG